MKEAFNLLCVIVVGFALLAFAFLLLGLMSIFIEGLGWFSLIMLAPVIFYTIAYHTPANRARRAKASFARRRSDSPHR